MIGADLLNLLATVIGGGLLLLFGIMGWRRSGKLKDQMNAKDEDYEHAEDIRDRVHRDLPSELRKYQDRGYRD